VPVKALYVYSLPSLFSWSRISVNVLQLSVELDRKTDTNLRVANARSTTQLIAKKSCALEIRRRAAARRCCIRRSSTLLHFAAVRYGCIGSNRYKSRTLCYMGDKIERKGSVNFVCGLPRRRRMPEDRISRGCTVAASAELTAEYTKPIQTSISSKKS